MTDSNPRPFDGKLALVTGASRGIGAATAEALGRAGAHVILTARTVTGLEAVEETIHEAGGAATIAPLDLSDLEAIPKLAAATVHVSPSGPIGEEQHATLAHHRPLPDEEGVRR